MSQVPQAHAHKLIVDTAIGMAHALYETMMSDNEWYKVWKRRNPGASPLALESRFVKKNLPLLLPQARATLAGMLASPGLPESDKERIHEALVLDNTLKRGRSAPALMPKEFH